jgi:carbamoyltransferase
MEHTYWGKSYNQNETLSAIKKFGFAYEEVHDTDKLATLATEDLLQGKVLGISQGRFEWGPRALGNRSIIADPRNEAMKSVVNEKIKFREPFRPFAPAILEERAGEFFDDIEDVENNYPLRFMLTVYKTRQEKKADLQAVSHEDGTGRVQTVRKELNPLYHRIIELFGEATGVPVILNTSFNLRGEPMVTTPENALNTFSKSGLETLYLNGFVIRK